MITIQPFTVPVIFGKDPELNSRPNEARKKILLPKIKPDDEIVKAAEIIAKEFKKLVKGKTPIYNLPFDEYINLTRELHSSNNFLDENGDLNQELAAVSAYISIKENTLVEFPTGLIDAEDENGKRRVRALMLKFLGDRNDLNTFYDLENFAGWSKAFNDAGLINLKHRHRIVPLINLTFPGCMNGKNPLVRPWKVAHGAEWSKGKTKVIRKNNQLRMLDKISKFVAEVKIGFINPDGSLNKDNLDAIAYMTGDYMAETAKCLEATAIGSAYNAMRRVYLNRFGWGKDQITPTQICYEKWEGKVGKNNFRKAVIKSMMDSGLGIENPKTRFLRNGFILHFTLDEFIYWRDTHFAEKDWMQHMKDNKLEGPYMKFCRGRSDELAKLLRGKETYNSKNITDIPMEEFSAYKVCQMRKAVKALLKEPPQKDEILKFKKGFGNTILGKIFPSDTNEEVHLSSLQKEIKEALVDVKNILITSRYKNGETTIEKLVTAKNDNGEYLLSNKKLKQFLQVIKNIIDKTNLTDEEKEHMKFVVSELLKKSPDRRTSFFDAIHRTNKKTLSYGKKSTYLKLLNSIFELILHNERISTTVDIPEPPAGHIEISLNGKPTHKKEIPTLQTILENPFRKGEPGYPKLSGVSLPGIISSSPQIDTLHKMVDALVTGDDKKVADPDSFFLEKILLAKNPEKRGQLLFTDEDLINLLTFIRSNIIITDEINLYASSRSNLTNVISNLLEQDKNIREMLLTALREVHSDFPDTSSVSEILDFVVGYIAGTIAIKEAVNSAKGKGTKTNPFTTPSTNGRTNMLRIAEEINKFRTGESEIYSRYLELSPPEIDKKAKRAREKIQALQTGTIDLNGDYTEEELIEFAEAIENVAEARRNRIDLSGKTLIENIFANDMRRACQIFEIGLDKISYEDEAQIALLCLEPHGYFSNLPERFLDLSMDDFLPKVKTLWKYTQEK